ncbi:MAG: putative lipoprotein LppC [Candidatus Anoxychlamydiales bacterium]|nr:putative lipoprotein LppC [Candidatus Anoxychlamydiales bacterium]
MEISFKDFNDKFLPQKYSCIGEKLMPTIEIKKISDKTKSLALIIDDPDAVNNKTFVHMILFNIDSNEKFINESTKGIYGLNDLNELNYCPPCPPKNSGTHRYFFKVYALDKVLNLDKRCTKKDLIASMENHIIEKKELVALFSQDQ